MRRAGSRSLGPMGQAPEVPQPADQRRVIVLGLMVFGLALMVAGLLMQPLSALWAGWGRILLSPGMLLTDGKAIGGVGAAFWNAGLMMLLSLALLWRLKAEITGTALAAVMIVTGFSFFGKNPLNALPPALGVLAYARLMGAGLAASAVPALFATALAPLTSSVAFSLGFEPLIGIPLALVLGLLGGFLMVPIAKRALPFHQGHNLYNSGFAAGLTAMLLVNVLRLFGLNIPSASFLHPGGGPVMALSFALFFLLLTGLGWRLNGNSFKGYGALLKAPGRLGPESDFIKRFGLALYLINGGLSSLLSLAVVMLAGAPLNGPVLGSVLTITGFAAFGKHPRNMLPVMLGALLATTLSVHEVQATHAMIAVIFSTTLAPIAGSYGPLAGLTAGILHAAIAHNSGFLHAGVNLYNNGFAGGLVAGLLTAVLEPMRQRWQSAKGQAS